MGVGVCACLCEWGVFVLVYTCVGGGGRKGRRVSVWGGEWGEREEGREGECVGERG